MIVSHSKKFVFIHIYKIAGQSVREVLRPFAIRPGIVQRFRLWCLKNSDRVGLQLSPSARDQIFRNKHVGAAVLREAISPARFSQYFKFAFARNPWDWHVSLYHYMQQTPAHHYHSVVAKLGSFDAYISWMAGRGYHSQKSFLVGDQGELLVDYVGRFEEITGDFQEVCSRLRIAGSLPHVNSSKRNSYKKYYTDKTRDLVTRVHQDDIEYFGYSFDGHPCQPIRRAA
jgi:hypothetical protein